MSKNGAIFRIVPYAASQVTVNGSDPAFPPSALANIQPKVVLRYTAAVPVTLAIDIDLGADTLISGVAALHTTLTPGSTGWEIKGASTAQGPLGTYDAEPENRRLFGPTGNGPFGVAPTTLEDRRFGLATGGPHTVRYLRVYLRETLLPFVQIGTLLVLQRLAMGQGQYDNFELGSGRRVDDRSQVRGLPGGETAIERGGRVPQWRASWSNVTEADYRGLWSILMEVGTGAPILAAEFQDGSTGQAEALHYGLIQSIDFSERVQLDKQRIELRIQELV